MIEFVCPVTRQPLRLVRDAGEFLEAPDGRRYPIQDGIPELLAPESRQLVEASHDLRYIDVEFPGWRGASHRTRYYGKLDGVAPELRQRVVDVAAREGVSINAWLEKTLRQALSRP